MERVAGYFNYGGATSCGWVMAPAASPGGRRANWLWHTDGGRRIGRRRWNGDLEFVGNYNGANELWLDDGAAASPGERRANWLWHTGRRPAHWANRRRRIVNLEDLFVGNYNGANER